MNLNNPFKEIPMEINNKVNTPEQSTGGGVKDSWMGRQMSETSLKPRSGNSYLLLHL